MKNLNDTTLHFNIEGVNVMVGYDIEPMKDIQLRLGKLNIQLIDKKDQVHTVYPTVLVDIADLRNKLAHPDTRNYWESTLRSTVGCSEDTHLLHMEIPDVTDVFVKRVLATQKVRNAGWRTSSASLDLDTLLG